MDVLDSETYFQLRNLVETLTHSGLKTLDENLFREIKKKCKLYPVCTEKVYSLILYQLKKRHSEIRLLAFQMCVELFKRSAVIRELIVKDLQLIFELVAETNPKKKLPPPKSAAENLKTLAISTIKKWHDEFGETYKELKIAFQYLKHVKKFNMQLLNVNSIADNQRQNHLRILQEEKVKAVLTEIDSNEKDIENTITTLSNCISLLIPAPDNFFINEAHTSDAGNSENHQMTITDPVEDDSEVEGNEITLKHFGVTPNYSITVDCSSVKNGLTVYKTEENSSVIQNAEDSLKLLRNRFLPMIKKWNSNCVKYCTGNVDIIQRVLSLKDKVEKCINKYEELKIENNSDEQPSDSDEFEEVKKPDYEEFVEGIENFEIANSFPATTKKSGTGWKISLGEDGDPTCALSTLKGLQGNTDQVSDKALPSCTESKICSQIAPETSASPGENMGRKNKLLATAPKIPFDVDLYHWEDENLQAPTLVSVKMDNPKFWGTAVEDDMDEIPNPEGVASLRTRVIEFSGKFEPVKWSCRAPMPNGKLCPRKDRFKCPFHGKIVPRDESGKEQHLQSASTRIEPEKLQSDWKDPELLEDIKMATGIDLTMPDKNKKKVKKHNMSKTHKTMKTSSTSLREIERRKFPGLTDTIGKQNSAYKRISKKIFNRRSVRRVSAALNKSDFAKHRDKFGDQFNYVYQT